MTSKTFSEFTTQQKIAMLDNQLLKFEDRFNKKIKILRSFLDTTNLSGSDLTILKSMVTDAIINFEKHIRPLLETLYIRRDGALVAKKKPELRDTERTVIKEIKEINYQLSLVDKNITSIRRFIKGDETKRSDEGCIQQ